MPRRGLLALSDQAGMYAALEQARQARTTGEVPVGAAVVQGGQVIAWAHNETVMGRDLTRHAELLAIQRALAATGSDRLDQASLYVTLEPCAQCAGAVVLARVARVVFGAYDPKAGMAGSVGDLLRHPRLNHHPEVTGGVMEEECGALLRSFFESMR
ncbi:MAG TPA: nucleoside deaminase [Gemmatimonadales bacterium]|nr:nucleoside deaminase [Gemmatimonadales bacterium]